MICQGRKTLAGGISEPKTIVKSMKTAEKPKDGHERLQIPMGALLLSLTVNN
jgi:hypothetical protein